MLITTLAATALLAAAPRVDNVRAVWNLTFLPGEPPSIGGQSSVDFSGLNSSASSLAAALDAAFNASQPQGTKKLHISAVNNSLVLEGEAALVDEVRRLLATQLDVPQSQILLELDAYQVSAKVKGKEAAERSVRRLVLAQEIARVYKVAHLQALKNAVTAMEPDIKVELSLRSQMYGLDISKLLRKVGIDPNPVRLLSQTDLLAFITYCQNDNLKAKYLAWIEKEFDEASASVQVTLLEPLEKSQDPMDRAIHKQLAELNATLANRWSLLQPLGPDKVTRSAFLRSVAQSKEEDEVSRHALEEFLMLWLGTADPAVIKVMREKLKPETTASEAYGVLRSMFGFGAKEAPGDMQEKLLHAVEGDLPAKLVRSSARMDDLIRVAMEGIQSDSRVLVDNPLRAWIDSRVVSESQNSGFSVRFGGTTKLAITSRAPGLIGSETETFFPFQPVSPISLDALTPLLSRKPVDPPAANGATPAEILLLQGIFAQAEKQPFYRKVGTGLHLGVVPTVLGNGSAARLQVRFSLNVEPDSNNSGPGSQDQPSPVDLVKKSVVETEIIANAFDIATLSSLKIDVTAPGKRDWAVPILSQILPIRSWFVGPTQDKTVRHEAVVLVKITIVPRAMDLASRFLNPNTVG